MTERLASLSQSLKTGRSSNLSPGPSGPAKSRRMNPTSPRSAIVSCSSRGSWNSCLAVRALTGTSQAKHTHLLERAYILFVHLPVRSQVLRLAEVLDDPLVWQFPLHSRRRCPRRYQLERRLSREIQKEERTHVKMSAYDQDYFYEMNMR